MRFKTLLATWLCLFSFSGVKAGDWVIFDPVPYTASGPGNVTYVGSIGAKGEGDDGSVYTLKLILVDTVLASSSGITVEDASGDWVWFKDLSPAGSSWNGGVIGHPRLELHAGGMVEHSFVIQVQ